MRGVGGMAGKGTRLAVVATCVVGTALAVLNCRPRPVRKVRPAARKPRFDPDKKIRALKGLLAHLPSDENGLCQKARARRDLGWLLLLYKGDRKGAHTAFQRVARSRFGRSDPWATWGLAVLAESAMDFGKAAGLYLTTAELASTTVPPFGMTAGLPCHEDPPLSAARMRLVRSALSGLSGLVQSDVTLKDLDARAKRLAGRVNDSEAVRTLNALRAELAWRRGDRQALDTLTTEAGCPTVWYIGPRVGGYGELDLFLTGAADLSRVSFHKEGGRGLLLNRRCDLVLYSPTGHPGVREATTRFALDSEQEAVIWVATGRRNLSVWLDGQPIHRPSGPSQWPPARIRIPVKLGPGSHSLSLLVPVGAGRHTLYVVMTDRSGRGLKTRHVVPGPTLRRARFGTVAERLKGAPPPSPLKPPKAGKGFEPLASFLVLTEAYADGEPHRGRVHSARLRKRAPRFAAGLILAAAVELADTTQLKSQARDRAARYLVDALEADPAAFQAMSTLVRLYRDADKQEEALRLIAKGTRKRNAAVWWAERARILQDNRFLTMANRAAERAVRLSQQSRSAWKVWLSVARQRRDLETVRRASWRLSLLDRSSDSWVQLLAQQGRSKEAVAEFSRLLSLKPNDRDLREGLARVLTQAGKHPDASAIYRKLVAEEAWNPDLRLALAQAWMELGRTQAARSVLKKGVQLKPSSMELRKALRGLGVSTAVAPYRISGKKVIEEYKKVGPPAGSGAGAVFVLDRLTDLVLPGGAMLRLMHQVVQLRSSTDLNRWGEVRVAQGAEVLRLRNIKPDGRVRHPAESSGVEPVSLPDLEVGDFIEMETIVTRPPLAALRGGFMGKRFYFRSLNAAMHRSEYVLITPANMKIQVDRRAGLPRARVRRSGPNTIRTWVMRRQSRLQSEPYSSPWLDIVPSVRVASGVTWTRLSRMLASRMLRSDRADYDMRALARRLCSRRKSAAARVRAVYDWVQDNIQQSGSLYDLATRTLGRRTGYRLTLMRALLRLCGVKSRTIMVEPNNRRVSRSKIPDVAPLRYPVLVVADEKSSRAHFLFPFLRSIPFGYLPAMLRSARAMEISALKQMFLRTPQKGTGRDRRIINIQAHLKANGSARVTVSETLHGWPAITLRRNLERMEYRRIAQDFERGRLSAHFPGAELIGKLVIKEPQRRNVPLRLRYAFKVPGLARTTSGQLVLRRAFYPARLARTYLTKPRRSYPLQVGAYPEFEMKLVIHPPPNHKPALVSSATKILAPFGVLDRSVRRASDGSVTIKLKRKLPFRRIPPSDYGRFGRFARKVDQAEQLVVTFASKGRAVYFRPRAVGVPTTRKGRR